MHLNSCGRLLDEVGIAIFGSGPCSGVRSVLPLLSALRGVSLSFASPKESKQRKGDPSSAPGYARSLALLVEPGGCGTRPFGPQTVLAEGPRPACVAQRLARGPRKSVSVQTPCLTVFAAFLRSTAKMRRFPPPPSRGRLGGGWVSVAQEKPIPTLALPLKGRELTPRAQTLVRLEETHSAPGRLSGPLGRCRATQKLAEKGRGLSEARRAEFRSPRQFRVAQGTGRSPAPYGGRLLFAYFFLAKQEKVRRAASAKPMPAQGRCPQQI